MWESVKQAKLCCRMMNCIIDGVGTLGSVWRISMNHVSLYAKKDQTKMD